MKRCMLCCQRDGESKVGASSGHLADRAPWWLQEEDSEDESDAKRLPPAAADAKEQPQECKQQ